MISSLLIEIILQSAEDEFGFNNFDENFNAPADFSINNYPQPYCGMVESLPTACFEVKETKIQILLSQYFFNRMV